MSYENVTSNKHSGMTKAKPVEDMMQTPNLKVSAERQTEAITQHTGSCIANQGIAGTD